MKRPEWLEVFVIGGLTCACLVALVMVGAYFLEARCG